MPFKIIQSIENGNIVLTCVPHKWERNGVLYWPRKQQQPHKLQKDEFSQPDDTWHQINCEVKRRNIKTYQDAMTEIDIMSNNSETEPDIEDVSAKKRRKCFNFPQASYNIMAEESLKNVKHNASSTTMPKGGNILRVEDTVTNQSSHSTADPRMVANNQTTTPIPSTPSGILLSTPQESIEKYVVIPESNQSDTPIIYSYINKETNLSEEQCNLKFMKSDINTIKSDLKSINDDMKTVMETLNTTLNNQAILHETLNSVLLKVTELQVMNEEFIKKSITEKQNQSLALKPIKDLKDLEEFENQLTDSNYREDLQKKLSVLCPKGNGQGTTSAYAVIDIMFERQFFKLCSWTGASRSQNEPTEKICFKSFSKTISFFFDFIHKLDSSFHLTDCHKFFKTILRNADQRSKVEPKRASTKKCRGKRRDKKTSFENLVLNETRPEQPLIVKQIGGNDNQTQVEDFREEFFV